MITPLWAFGTAERQQVKSQFTVFEKILYIDTRFIGWGLTDNSGLNRVSRETYVLMLRCVIPVVYVERKVTIMRRMYQS